MPAESYLSYERFAAPRQRKWDKEGWIWCPRNSHSWIIPCSNTQYVVPVAFLITFAVQLHKIKRDSPIQIFLFILDSAGRGMGVAQLASTCSSPDCLATYSQDFPSRKSLRERPPSAVFPATRSLMLFTVGHGGRDLRMDPLDRHQMLYLWVIDIDILYFS